MKISADDLEAMRFHGIMGHRWFVVRDNRSISRDKPGVVRECNDLAGCLGGALGALPGDRIYQKTGPRKYKLVQTVQPAASSSVAAE